MRVVTGFCFAAALLGLLVTERASACSMRCPSNRTASFEGVTLPASIPEIPFLAVRGAASAQDVTLAFEGRMLPITVGGEGVRPAAPLTAGVYTLRFPDGGCASDAGVVEKRIELGSAVPLPTHALDVTVRSTGRGSAAVQVMTGECYKEVPAAVISLDVKPSRELEPFMPVVHFETRIDGNLWATSDFGTIEPRSTGNFYADPALDRVDRITRVCATDGAAGATGHHVVEVSARIGDTIVGEPARLDLEIPLASSCDFAVDGRSTANPTGAAPDAKAIGTGPGCSTSAARTSAGGIAWLVLGLASLAHVRRRARSHRLAP